MRSAGLLLASPDAPSTEWRDGRAHAALHRLRRGAYVGADHWRALSDDDRYRLLVRAVAAAQPDALVSHRSAAALLGLPLVGRSDGHVHLMHAPRGGGRSRGDVRRHQAGGAVSEVRVDGIRVTSPARTVVDLACDEGLLPAVVAGDAVLRAGSATTAQVAAEVSACGRRRGVCTARRAVSLLNARSESPGESLSRVRMVELGLPAPALQRELRDHAGFVARVDFFWDAFGVVGEFDGRAKYGSDDPRATADRVWNEKRREDRVRAMGLVVVRWTWDDAWLGAPMARLLRAAGVH